MVNFLVFFIIIIFFLRKDQTHTIIMAQFNEDPKTRSYLHFSTLNEALECLQFLFLTKLL